jgi:hypothetical protein
MRSILRFFLLQHIHAMTKRTTLQLHSILVKQWPTLLVKGSFLYFPRSSHVLNGFVLDSSRWQKGDFYVYALAQPLYYPTENLNLGLAEKLEPANIRLNWNMSDPSLKEEVIQKIQTIGIRYIESHRTVEQMLKRELAPPNRGTQCREHPFTLMMLGRYAEAAALLESTLSLYSPEIQWHREARDLDEQFIDLCRHHSHLVPERLAEIENETWTRIFSNAYL